MQTLQFTGKGAPRLDQFILKQCPGLTPGLLHKYLRQNKIKLNGKKQPLNTRLADGDTVQLFLPSTAEKPFALAVLYEDEHILAVNKPAGIATNNEDDPHAPNTLLAYARAYTGSPVLPCHRLDTGTSGVVLFAKHEDALQMVTGLMQAHQLTKLYHCVTFGHPTPPSATLGGWHTKNAAKGLVAIGPHKTPGAKPVQTQYTTLATQGPLALLQVRLITGRTHQIRAHLAGIGAPILGDGKYGNFAANRQYHCRYQCLQASEVIFPGTVPAPYAALAGLRISCPPAWYQQKILQGEFA